MITRRTTFFILNMLDVIVYDVWKPWKVCQQRRGKLQECTSRMLWPSHWSITIMAPGSGFAVAPSWSALHFAWKNKPGTRSCGMIWLLLLLLMTLNMIAKTSKEAKCAPQEKMSRPSTSEKQQSGWRNGCPDCSCWKELNSGVFLLCLVICVINVVPSQFLLCSWHHSYSVCQSSCIWRIYCYLLWLRASKYEINTYIINNRSMNIN